MAIFVSSVSSVRRHGSFAIERTPPTTIVAAGTGVCAIVGVFPWGPDSATDPIYLASSAADRAATFAPAGMTRTGSGYLSIIQKAFPTLRVVRVLGTAAAKATVNIQDSVPANAITVTAKYKGTAGNSISVVIAAASDGDANHFNMTATVTGPSGTTVDTLQNLSNQAVGSGYNLDQIDASKLRLIGSVAKVASVNTRPVNGTYTLAGGADGTIDASAYSGTAGTGDKGIAKLEGDKSVRHVFLDDPGNSLRAGANAALIAHCVLMGDRVCYISGNSGLDAASAITDVGSYSSDRALYIPNWVYQRDEAGTLRLIPGTSFAASVNAQLSPSTSIAWKNSEVIQMLAGIVSLERDYGEATADLTDAGACVLIKEETGGHTFESDNTTITRADPARRKNKRRKVLDYIAASFVRSTRGSVDAPNVAINRQDLRIAVDNFMATMKRNAKQDPNHTPHVTDYQLQPDSAANDQNTINAGQYHVPLAVQISPDMEQIFLSVLATVSGDLTVQEAT